MERASASTSRRHTLLGKKKIRGRPPVKRAWWLGLSPVESSPATPLVLTRARRKHYRALEVERYSEVTRRRSRGGSPRAIVTIGASDEPSLASSPLPPTDTAVPTNTGTTFRYPPSFSLSGPVCQPTDQPASPRYKKRTKST